MENMNAFSSGFPLEHLPELTEEVFFAFHSGIQKMLYLNPAFDEIWSISRNDVLSDLSLLTNSVHPDDKDFVAASFSDLQKKQQHIEFRIQLGGGSIKWIKLNAYISKSDREIIVGTAADISGLKDYAHVLHKFTEKKNSILEILSHDLLGPLGNIKMAMTLLNSYPEISSNEEIMRLMNIVSNSCQRGVSMIHDLTNKEFLQTSEAKIVKERVDLVEKIKEMVAQLMQSPREGHPAVSL